MGYTPNLIVSQPLGSITKYAQFLKAHDPNLTLNKNLKFKFKFVTVFSVTAFVSINSRAQNVVRKHSKIENVQNKKIGPKPTKFLVHMREDKN